MCRNNKAHCAKYATPQCNVLDLLDLQFDN